MIPSRPSEFVRPGSRRSFMRRSALLTASACAARCLPPPISAAQTGGTPSPESSRAAGAVELLIAGYDSPEGPAFDRDGNLFFVNWTASSIVKMAPDGTSTEFFNTGGVPAGLAFHPDGSLYVADEGDDLHGILKITPDAQMTIVVNEFQGQPLNGANDLVFDKNGALYFTDPWGSDPSNPIGGVYRLLPDGTLEQIDTGLAFPNGIELTADGSAVIVGETGQNRLLRYSIAADG